VRVVAEAYSTESGRAENLSALVRTALERAGARGDDVTALAVVDGPGSYTGLRVGLALARGIAAAGDVPVAVCGSLELIAETCPSGERVCALLDAAQGKVYAAGFVREGGRLCELHAPVIVAAADLPEELTRWGGKWIRCADAPLAAELRADTVALAERAGRLAQIGARRVHGGELRTAEEELPR
jgi:tRNA threonylcarbamoyl adenosine modification protein YeaZ